MREKYNFSKVPIKVENYIYKIITRYLNLQKHLANRHGVAYNKAIVDNSWNYCLLSNVKSGKSDIEACKKISLPLFT